MRQSGLKSISLSSRRVQPPLLLAVPFACLAAASIASPGFTGLRLVGGAALLCATGICLGFGLRYSRRQLESFKSEVHETLESRMADDDVKFIVGKSRSNSEPAMYELTRVTRKGSTLLYEGRLKDLLNHLRHSGAERAIPVEFSLKAQPALTKSAIETSPGKFELAPQHVELSGPSVDAQWGLAGVLGAIALLGAIVVGALIRNQVLANGPFDTPGLLLGSLLCVAPGLVATHVALGRVRLALHPSALIVERRRGLVGAQRITIARNEIEGLWFVSGDDAPQGELLLASAAGFMSLPLAKSVIHQWQAALDLAPQ